MKQKDYEDSYGYGAGRDQCRQVIDYVFNGGTHANGSAIVTMYTCNSRRSGEGKTAYAKSECETGAVMAGSGSSTISINNSTIVLIRYGAVQGVRYVDAGTG